MLSRRLANAERATGLVASAYVVSTLRPPVRILLVPLLIALLVVGYGNATRLAGHMFNAREVLLADVVLFLRADAEAEIPEELKRGNDRGELKLITHTADRVFVHWQPPSAPPSEPAGRGYTFQIPKEALHGHRVRLDGRHDAASR